MSFNKIFLHGRIARDPELRYLSDGTPVLSFSIPDNQGRGDKEVTTWFRVSIFRQRAETLSQYLVKGSECVVEGQVRLNEWQDKDGKPRSSLEVAATDVHFVGKRPESSQAAAAGATSNTTTSDTDDAPF